MKTTGERITEELKPCPFCGITERDHDEGSPMLHLEWLGRRQRVKCDGCASSGAAKTTAEEAIIVWNRRIDEALVTAEGEVERLRDSEEFWRRMRSKLEDLVPNVMRLLMKEVNEELAREALAKKEG